MRLAPVVLFSHPDADSVDHYSAESSLTTHGAAEAVASCRVLGRILHALLSGQPKQDAIQSVPEAEWMSPGLKSIAASGYVSKAIDEIKGSGYVVESLEAALWCFHTTDSFQDAILAATNLGDDADTTAAVCGQLAGAHYGAMAIPSDWLDGLFMRDTIKDWATQLVQRTP